MNFVNYMVFCYRYDGILDVYPSLFPTLEDWKRFTDVDLHKYAHIELKTYVPKD